MIGLLCAALGRPRHADLHDLAELQMGVRVDREGILWREWQTAQSDPKRTNISTRYYLADAAFLVGLAHPHLELLEKLQRALRDPRWHLFLGRKSCPPAVPPYLKDGVHDEELLPVLSNYPWLGQNQRHYENLGKLRVVLDDPNGTEMRSDLPVSFATRTFHVRRVQTDFIDKPPFWQAQRDDAAPESFEGPEEALCTYRV
jgi:CRISPR system Cascade subunit CasD